MIEYACGLRGKASPIIITLLLCGVMSHSGIDHKILATSELVIIWCNGSMMNHKDSDIKQRSIILLIFSLVGLTVIRSELAFWAIEIIILFITICGTIYNFKAVYFKE